MDFADLRAENSTLELMNPRTNEPLGVTLHLLSPEDAKMKSLTAAIKNTARMKANRGKVIEESEMQAHRIRMANTAVYGWSWEGAITLAGETNPEFSPERLERLLKTAPWIIDKIDEAYGDESRFFK